MSAGLHSIDLEISQDLEARQEKDLSQRLEAGKKLRHLKAITIEENMFLVLDFSTLTLCKWHLSHTFEPPSHLQDSTFKQWARSLTLLKFLMTP
eukprot:1151014-Pelagomonas_calceolata.AAC.4